MGESRPNGRRHAEHRGAGDAETANPCGCKSEQGLMVVRYRPGFDAEPNAAQKQKGAYSSHSIVLAGAKHNANPFISH